MVRPRAARSRGEHTSADVGPSGRFRAAAPSKGTRGPARRGPRPPMDPLERPTPAAQVARGLAYGAGLYVLFTLLCRWLP